jgi:RimJ/RimL family protein N-acetyltransferase
VNIWEGKGIRLRAVEPEDWRFHFEWDQDSSVSRAIDAAWFPKSVVASKQWAEEAALQSPQDDNLHLQIETLDGQQVGSINSHDCDMQHGTFSYGVAIRSDFQRQGYASAAILVLLRFFFTERRYQKANAQVFSFNKASIRLHEKLGFQQEGRLRRMKFSQGQYHDELQFGMTQEEFFELHPADQGDLK